MLRSIINIFFLFLFFQSILPAQTKDTLRLDFVEKILPFGLTEKVPANLPRIGLALSGGGARSISQLGVLKAFEEKQIPIEYIVGTSMGSIIGGLYSAGYSLTQLDSILKSNNWEDFYSIEQSKRNELFVDQKITEDRALISFRLDGFSPVIPNSISSGQRPANFLNLLAINAPIYAEENFDEYLYKFRAVASDLVNGNEIILDKVPLGLAMRASSSVTFLLPPVAKDSLLLVDGGLVANIPAKETRELGADIVIAVDASSPLYQKDELQFPWNIADQLVSIPMQKLNYQQIEHADFVIKPDINERKNSDFTDLESLVKKGYNAALPVTKNISKRFEEMFKDKLNTETKYYKNLSILNSGDISLKLFDSLANRDSVSNKDLLYQIYILTRDGQYRDLIFELTEDEGTSSLKIIAEPNPVVKDFELAGDSIITKSEILKCILPLIDKPYSPKATLNAALEILRLYKHEDIRLRVLTK
jgi:NTE family protein